MELNQTTLRGILAAILSVNLKYIVPKQGNWWNPQETGANVANWCAYRIKSNSPRTAPFYNNKTAVSNNTQTKVNSVYVEKIADIELQFVGPDSETLAQSVCMWPMRADVQAQFKSVQGAVMYDDFNAVSSFFAQEGANTVTAWNVNFRVLWMQNIDTTQQHLVSADINGNIK